MPHSSPGRRALSRLRSRVVPEWSGRNFRLVFAARLAMSASRALAGVITPVYLALIGFSALMLGALVGVVAAVSALMSIGIGMVSDRVGRRPFLIVTPMLATVAGVVFAFDRTIAVLFVAAALGSFGRGAGAGAGTIGPYQPAESAFVTEALTAKARNSAFGRLSFASSVGALAGGLLALLGPSVHLTGAAATDAFRAAYLVTAGLALLAGLLAVFITEPRRKASGEAARGGRFRFPRRSRGLVYRLWATNGVNGLAVGMFGPFVTYWFFRRFGATAGEIGVLFAVINAVTALSTLSAAGLARRWGLVPTVTVVRVAQAVLLVPLVLMPTFAAAGAVYLVRMAVQRVGLPLRQSYVLAMADPSERAAVSGLSNVPSQLATAASPLLSGYLFDEVSLSLPFDLAAVLQALNAGLFWVFFRHAPPEEEAAAMRAAEAESEGASESMPAPTSGEPPPR